MIAANLIAHTVNAPKLASLLRWFTSKGKPAASIPAAMSSSPVPPQSGIPDPKSLYDFVVWDVYHREQIPLSRFKGMVTLVVNVATKCGFTASNYAQLAELDAKYHSRGLRILLFPCNQFGNQEPGTGEDVCHFIEGYSKQFTIAEKCDVNGANEHPVYAYLKEKQHGFLFDAIKWNFTKFSVNRAGQPVARFAPNDEPKSFESKIVELLDQK